MAKKQEKRAEKQLINLKVVEKDTTF